MACYVKIKITKNVIEAARKAFTSGSLRMFRENSKIICKTKLTSLLLQSRLQNGNVVLLHKSHFSSAGRATDL